MQGKTDLARRLVFDEIRRVVADCIGGQGCVWSAAQAVSIAAAHPESGMTAAEIAQEIIVSAVAAQVPVEIGVPASGPKAVFGIGPAEPAQSPLSR